MWIACAVALASLGCSEVVFPTLKASRVAGFVSSQLGELGSRTSQLVEQEKFEKLAMLRRSLTRRFAEYALDDSWRDDAGSCEIKMRTRSAGGTSLYIRVSGVGSKRVCRASLGALHKSFVDHDLSKRVTTFVDMSTAVSVVEYIVWLSP